MNHHSGWAPALLALAMAGCASSPTPLHGDDVRELVTAHQARLPATAPARALEAALQDALASSPAARAIWARYGITEAEVREALRLHNPTLGLLRLSGAGGYRETQYSLSQPLLELLFSGYRHRQGEIATRQAMQHCAAQLLAFEADVRVAYLVHAAAGLAWRVAGRGAEAASLSAALAGRYREAGNISELQWQREQAAASEAALQVLQRRVALVRARASLFDLLGRTAPQEDDPAWMALPLLDAEPAPLAELQQYAGEQRLDLAALRAERDLRAAQAVHARRWGWLSGLSLEGARERGGGEPVRSGAGASLELPLFDGGGNRRRRAGALLQLREAELAGLATQVANEVAARRAEVLVQREAVAVHARALVERRERIVELTQQRADFMLVGSFELILARRQQMDAWQAWVEGVARLGTAQVRLAQALGRAAPEAAEGAAATMLTVEDLP